MKRTSLLIAFLFFSFPILISAQKIEVEKRVSQEKAPAPMQQFLHDKYPGKRRVKYYEERNESGRFFEAKFCFDKLRYSVKFTPEGELVDTERKVKFRQLPANLSEQINKQLSEQFQRYKVVKTQEMLEDGRVVGYELEVKGKKGGELGYFEGQFDARGRQQGLRAIEQPPNDFLFF